MKIENTQWLITFELQELVVTKQFLIICTCRVGNDCRFDTRLSDREKLVKIITNPQKKSHELVFFIANR